MDNIKHTTGPEAEANARLIAAAPAMLEALRSIARDDDGDAMLDAAGMDRIAAILARIDGTPTAQPAGAIGEAGAGAPAVYGIAAEPFALFQSADGQAVIIERHDGPSPVIRAIDRTKFGAMVAAALEREA